MRRAAITRAAHAASGATPVEAETGRVGDGARGGVASEPRREGAGIGRSGAMGGGLGSGGGGGAWAHGRGDSTSSDTADSLRRGGARASEGFSVGEPGSAGAGAAEGEATSSAGLDLNVLVLMLDSISAARFKEGMPLTHALLESWAAPTAPEDASASARHNVTALGSAQRRGASADPATDPAADPAADSAAAAASDAGTSVDGAEGWRSFRFDRYVVVGSNSPRNQLPLLSGFASLEFARDHGGVALDCIVPGFPETRAPADHSCHRWVFDAYKAAGYVSLFGTNMCDWGVMEEVYPFGTRRPPTDHHMMAPWCHTDYDVDKLYFRPVSRCLGGVPAHEPLLEYERGFLNAYTPAARAFSWTIYLEGHEPSFRLMGSLDAALSSHLLRLRASGRGQDTAILVLSDHGIHYGTYYDGCDAGLLEHATPLLYALLPRAVLAAHPRLEAALGANRRRLVSPFDLHATLLHMLSYPARPLLPDWSEAAMRLRPKSILSPLPARRSCEDAGIPAGVCPCLGAVESERARE